MAFRGFRARVLLRCPTRPRFQDNGAGGARQISRPVLTSAVDHDRFQGSQRPCAFDGLADPRCLVERRNHDRNRRFGGLGSVALRHRKSLARVDREKGQKTSQHEYDSRKTPHFHGENGRHANHERRFFLA